MTSENLGNETRPVSGVTNNHSLACFTMLLDSIFELNNDWFLTAADLIEKGYRVSKYSRHVGVGMPHCLEVDEVYSLYKEGNLLVSFLLVDGTCIARGKDIVIMLAEDTDFNEKLCLLETTEDGYVVKPDSGYIVPQSVNGVIPFEAGKLELYGELCNIPHS